ncbi:MAG TPA: hypothetical protein VGM03_03985 [Phycisphaerae bacterium]|jgi:hypothetical protein
MPAVKSKNRDGVAALRRRAKRQIEQLSPERLEVAIDFLGYLEERESNEATEELLRIPGLVDAFAEAKKDIAAGRGVNWRRVRRDV